MSFFLSLFFHVFVLFFIVFEKAPEKPRPMNEVIKITLQESRSLYLEVEKKQEEIKENKKTKSEEENRHLVKEDKNEVVPGLSEDKYLAIYKKIHNLVTPKWNEEYNAHKENIESLEQEATVLAKINKQGYLVEVNIQKSSGSSIFDEIALATFKKISYLGSLPEALFAGQDSLYIQYTFEIY